jgi:hypothetical protein
MQTPLTHFLVLLMDDFPQGGGHFVFNLKANR